MSELNAELKEASYFWWDGYYEGYLKGLEVGEAEGLTVMAGLIRLKAEAKFPGIKLGKEVEAAGDIYALANLYLRFDGLLTAERLHEQLAELQQNRVAWQQIHDEAQKELIRLPKHQTRED